MPRYPYAYQIWRGGSPPRKVARWLARAGIDERFVTDEMRARHVHPRHLCGQKASQKASHVPDPSPSAALADSQRTGATGAASDPFARLRGL